MKRRIGVARQRLSFTLIEFLVVMGIIVTFIGLIVPAVYKVREAAARTQCICNLKQIGLGFQNYHDQIQYLPDAGGTYPTFSTASPPRANGVGTYAPPDGNPCTSASCVGLTGLLGQAQPGPWSIQILPFIEGTNWCVRGGSTNATGNAWVGKWDLPVKTFLDPGRSRNGMQGDGPVGALDFALNYVCYNHDCIPVLSDGAVVLYTGGLQVKGSNDTVEFTPTEVVRKKETLSDIKDGTSNTIAVGEKLVNIDAYNSGGAEPDCGYGWSGQGTLRWGGGEQTAGSPPTLANCRDSKSTVNPQPAAGSFGSPYRSGVPFVFFDGSTHTIGFRDACFPARLTGRQGDVIQGD